MHRQRYFLRHRCLNDDEYTILEVNQGFLELFGFSREELAVLFAAMLMDA